MRVVSYFPFSIVLVYVESCELYFSFGERMLYFLRDLCSEDLACIIEQLYSYSSSLVLQL